MCAVRVLLVDDHSLFRAAIANLLQSEPGFEVVGEAADGAEAVEQVRIHRPDVILMDLSMSVMDGLAATRQILARDASARVIILTAYESQDSQIAASASGALGCLPKNADLAVLYGTIRRIAGVQTSAGVDAHQAPPERAIQP